MEKKLDNYCTKIAVLMYSRYYIYSFDVDIGIIEFLEDRISNLFDKMYQELELEKNCSVFRHFFWSRMKLNSEWQKGFEEFGKDFNGTVDYINELLDRPYEYD